MLLWNVRACCKIGAVVKRRWICKNKVVKRNLLQIAKARGVRILCQKQKKSKYSVPKKKSWTRKAERQKRRKADVKIGQKRILYLTVEFTKYFHPDICHSSCFISNLRNATSHCWLKLKDTQVVFASIQRTQFL